MNKLPYWNHAGIWLLGMCFIMFLVYSGWALDQIKDSCARVNYSEARKNEVTANAIEAMQP